MAQNYLSLDWNEIVDEFTTRAKHSNKIHFDSPRERVCIDGASQSKGIWTDSLLLDAVVCFYRGGTAGSSKRSFNQHNTLNEAVCAVLELRPAGSSTNIRVEARGRWSSFEAWTGDMISRRPGNDLAARKLMEILDACDLRREISMVEMLNEVVRRIWMSKPQPKSNIRASTNEPSTVAYIPDGVGRQPGSSINRLEATATGRNPHLPTCSHSLQQQRSISSSLNHITERLDSNMALLFHNGANCIVDLEQDSRLEASTGLPSRMSIQESCARELPMNCTQHPVPPIVPHPTQAYNVQEDLMMDDDCAGLWDYVGKCEDRMDRIERMIIDIHATIEGIFRHPATSSPSSDIRGVGERVGPPAGMPTLPVLPVSPASFSANSGRASCASQSTSGVCTSDESSSFSSIEPYTSATSDDSSKMMEDMSDEDVEDWIQQFDLGSI